jgi:predicted N-acyltransferase
LGRRTRDGNAHFSPLFIASDLFLTFSSFFTARRIREHETSLSLPKRPFLRRKIRNRTGGARQIDSPDGFTTTVYESIHDLDRRQWDQITGANALVRSHDYLAAIEAASINDCKYFYPVVLDKTGALVGHACVYTITTDFSQLLPKHVKSIAYLVRRLWPKFLRFKVTECASPMTASHGISILAGKDSATIIREIGRAIEKIAESQCSNLVVIRDFLTHEREIFDSLLDDDFNVVSNMPLARIRVRWSSYEEYLSSMRSKYRKDVKRRLLRARRAGQEVCTVTSFGDNSKQWVEQSRTVFEKTKGFKREVLGCGYYEHMDRQLGERSVLVAAKRDQRFVAHGMILHDDVDTIATYFGRDRGPASQEWFQLVNEVIRIGIERKSNYVNLGLGSYDAKTNVGADVEPLYVYSKSTIAFVNWLMKLFRGTMEYPIDNAKRVFHE